MTLIALSIYATSASSFAAQISKSCPDLFADVAATVVRDGGGEPTIVAAWRPSQFTNPASHHPQSFRYIVHTVDLATRRYGLPGVYDHLVSSVLNDSNIAFSASVIDQGHTGTFGRIGFILKVPAQNIMAVRPSDMGTFLYRDLKGRDKKAIEDTTLRYPLTTPAALLSRTLNISYNEVLVRGEGIEITGIVRKQISDSEATALTELSSKFGLPIIELPWP